MGNQQNGSSEDEIQHECGVSANIYYKNQMGIASSMPSLFNILLISTFSLQTIQLSIYYNLTHQLYYKNQKMGNKLCCNSTIIKEQSLTTPEIADEQIKNFMDKNEPIAEVCTNPGQIYGTVEKTQLIKYNIGTYIGRIANKKRNGLGVMLFDDNMYYEGEWIDDDFNGKGKFIFSNGDFYDGEWKNNMPEGQGLYVSRKPIWRYQGHWESGVQNGYGKQVFQDGSFYEGDFHKGLRHGKGKFRNHDGTFYEGNFVNGQVHGYAKICNFNYMYQGEWKNGIIDGAGKSSWYDSKQEIESQYIGEYKQGKKNGFGQYRENDGIVYKGKWKNGEVTNNGILIKNQNQSNKKHR